MLEGPAVKKGGNNSMNMKRVFAMMLTLIMALALCACGGEESSVENATEAPEQATEAPVAATEASEEPTEAEEVSGTVYTVKVQDEGGNPVVGAMVQLCQGEICLMPAATDDSGAAVFTTTEDGNYEAKFVVMPSGYEYTTEEQVFHFDAGSYELTITLKAVA